MNLIKLSTPFSLEARAQKAFPGIEFFQSSQTVLSWK